MYVIDTTLAPGSRISPDSTLQRLVFALPAAIQAKVRKDQRKLLGKDAAKQAPLPWDEHGLVTYSFLRTSRRSQPLICDRRDEPLPRRSRDQLRVGQRVRLSLRQVPRLGTPRLGTVGSTRLEVLKVQLPLVDAPAGKGKPASPHSIQTVKMPLPVDLLQEVERLADTDGWSVSAWLRNAIESQVSREQGRIGTNRPAA